MCTCVYVYLSLYTYIYIYTYIYVHTHNTAGAGAGAPRAAHEDGRREAGKLREGEGAYIKYTILLYDTLYYE